MSPEVAQTALPRTPEAAGRRYARYLCRMLYQRGLGAALVDEGVSVACQELTLLWPAGGVSDWPGLRRVLDAAVYRAARELRPTGLALFDTRPARGEPLSGPAAVADLLDGLPARDRLVWRLKQSWYYHAGLPERVLWDADESAHLSAVHGGRTVDEVSAEFLARLRAADWGERRSVPSAVVAWLVGRKSAGAVDEAYSSLCKRLRRELAGWDEG